MSKGGRSLAVTVALLAGCAVVAAGAGYGVTRLVPRPPAFHGTTYEPAKAAPDFSLVDHDGRRVSLASFRGEPVLLFFGFTHCPDVCPTTLGRLGRIVDRLGDDGKDVRIVLVTVDPERDTPEALKAYVSRFHPRAVGLTGAAAELERARQGYGAYVEPAHGGTLAHTTAVYGIDRQGVLRVVFSNATEAEAEADIRTLARL